MKKYALPALILLLIAGTVYYVSKGDSDKREGGTVSIIAVKAYKQSLHDNVEALGTAHANESITITASASETIREILFADGQAAKKGDIIARLEQEEEQAELGIARARLEEHKRELERIESLLKNKAASRRDLDERKTLIEIAKREVDGIEARIADRTLRAPFDGTLGIRRLSVGALVQPGDVITTLDNIHPIKLDFTVPAIHLSALVPDVAIEARSDALPDQVFTGTVDSVDSRVDPITRAVLVRALIDNPDGLIKPGLLMKVTLLKDARESVVVPEESILQKKDEHFVLIVQPESNKVEERKIAPGVRMPGVIEARNGVEEGELVIVRGINRVKPGQTVTLKEVWNEARPPETAPEVKE